MDFLIALLNNSDALLHSTLVAATPLLFAALGETFVQRAGIINIGLEGILLTGAFAGMTASYFSGSPLLGLIVGAVSGLLLALLFAGLTVGLSADQIVVGVGLNLLAAGLTGVLYRGIFGVTGQALQVSTFLPIHIPFFSTLPILGSSLFQHAGLVYLAITLCRYVHSFFFTFALDSNFKR